MFRRRRYTDLTDESLMSRLAQGDERAFQQLYQRYGQRVMRYFYQRLQQNQAEAEDFTQQVFLKIIERADTFDPNHSFTSWVFTLAANLLKNEYRRRDRYQQRLAHLPLPTPPHGQDWHDQLDRDQWATWLAQALDRLNPDQRECFLLRYRDELSIRDISLLMQIPEGTVKSRIHHALRRLADELAAVAPQRKA